MQDLMFCIGWSSETTHKPGQPFNPRLIQPVRFRSQKTFIYTR